MTRKNSNTQLRYNFIENFNFYGKQIQTTRLSISNRQFQLKKKQNESQVNKYSKKRTNKK